MSSRLSIHVYPRLPFRSPPSSKDVLVEVHDVILNGTEGKLVQERSRDTGHLGMVFLYRDGVEFAWASDDTTRDFRKSPWWPIASSFRFVEQK